jgi:hypothetical protein
MDSKQTDALKLGCFLIWKNCKLQDAMKQTIWQLFTNNYQLYMVPTESTSITSNGRNTCQSHSHWLEQNTVIKVQAGCPAFPQKATTLSGRERMAKLNWQEWYNERDDGPSPPPFKWTH